VAAGVGTLTGVASVAGGFCGLMTSGGVDCWGGQNVQLANGDVGGSYVPVPVEGVGGTGTLTGVTSLASDDVSYCALLTSSGVDCWGNGQEGQLGNGVFYGSSPDGSATPVQVEGVGGTGTLTGVASLATDTAGYCAVLTSGGVDCWGDGTRGELGNGVFYTPPTYGSAVPVAVEGVGGTGALTGATSLGSDDEGYCAVLASGGVDCWGYGPSGQLGDGTFYTSGDQGSAVPVRVEGASGTGTLTGGDSVTGDGDSYCALLTSSEVDCWGDGQSGELGDGQFHRTSPYGSAVPVKVEGVDGTGTLTGAASLTSYGDGLCALLASGGVDCWGDGSLGELGDGTFYITGNSGSAVPVQVDGVGGSGTLTGATGLASTYASNGLCAVLASGGVDCWGNGYNGQLGDGQLYPNSPHGSAVPVEVEGVGGTGVLTGAIGVTSTYSSYCALLASSGVDCWGSGDLGNGIPYGSPFPVQVEAVGG
jgi:alpha-tubulin suppressor-like RCC1 family protein